MKAKFEVSILTHYLYRDLLITANYISSQEDLQTKDLPRTKSFSFPYLCSMNYMLATRIYPNFVPLLLWITVIDVYIEAKEL